MIRQLSKKNFVDMPWKNGKGKTIELFQLASENTNSFLLRISMATVSSDGPFSVFPNIDRTLILISGPGMILKNLSSEFTLNERLQPFNFAGEDFINCRLLGGPCLDFNVMVDRRYGKAKTMVISSSNQEFSGQSDLNFVYDTTSDTLVVLEKGDYYHFTSTEKSFLIVINFSFIEKQI